MMKRFTYAESGVDLDKEDKAVRELVASLTAKRSGIGRALGGHYAGMIEFGDYALVLCTDGVGSKVLIASAMRKWDTVGIDCIAMNVNDAICVGAEPLAFVDYLAIDDPEPEITKQIGRGLQSGATQANISIIGGETASLPGLIKGFDLAGTCLAYVPKKDIVSGNKIQNGDVIIGLTSSGVHSNGFSLVRHILKENKLRFNDRFPTEYYEEKTIGEVLLTPTHIYVSEILSLLKEVDVHGLAHITGGGLRNLPRLNNQVRYQLDNLITPPPIFDFIQSLGHVSLHEMYQTFNMGTGFMTIVAKDDIETSISILKKTSQMSIQTIGKITKGKGVIVPSLHLEYRC